jgi:outer membrane protein OmpA-like peptidoglycan-associated protein
LIAMNLWTVPTVSQGPSMEGERVTRTPPKVPTVEREPAPVPTPARSNVASHSPEAGPSGAEDAAVAKEVGSTTTVTDGTELPSIRFEPQSRALSPEMSKKVEPIAAYLRHHFGMKVVVVGHGDEGMNAADYVRTGRLRAAAVLRLLVDYGVTAARIGIELPVVEGDRVVGKGVPPGAVELRIEPRFVQPKKGGEDGP